jgi:hypothetical protein
MLDEVLLQNVFFSFWYVFGDYFLVVLGWTSAVALTFGIVHVLTKR